MPNLYVVFVPDDGRNHDTRLSQFLVEQHIDVRKEVAVFPPEGEYQKRGACFIFCRDGAPPPALAATVAACRAALGQPQSAVLFHAGTMKADNPNTAKLLALQSSGKALDGFGTFKYHRSHGTSEYEALMSSLRTLRDRSATFLPIERLMVPSTTLGKVGQLRHQLSHVLLPMAIDIQGLEECGFDQGYCQEVAKAYEGADAQALVAKVRAFVTGPGSLQVLGAQLRHADITASVERLLALLSTSDAQYADAVLPLVDGLVAGRLADVQEHAHAFLAWHGRFENEWDELIAKLDAAASETAAARRPAEKEPARMGR